MRIADRSVIKLIRMWLKTPVVEQQEGGAPPKVSRSKSGTPQGGVISPLLSNIYLHWFDKVFHRPGGPGQWANAKLVRYADDFVVLARHQTKALTQFIESKLEQWMGLELNREKTRIVDLKQVGAQFGFSGIHVPIRPGSAWPPASLSERGSIEAGLEEGTGSATGHDRQPVLFQADSRSDRGPESESPGLGPPISASAIPVRLTGISTTMSSSVCGFIFDDAANARIVRPKA